MVGKIKIPKLFSSLGTRKKRTFASAQLTSSANPTLDIIIGDGLRINYKYTTLLFFDRT
jgi:hypothetical protein